MNSHRWHDFYTKRAREEGFPARSVYKLQEIQKNFRILKPGDRILDLGCSPGSWLLWASKIVGDKGLVVGVDIVPPSLQLLPNMQFVQYDILTWDTSFLKAVGGPFEVVLSDMAPSTTGSKFVDCQRSLALSECALAIASRLLKAKGFFVCKVFQGPDFARFSDQTKKLFGRVTHFKPKSTRKQSKEIYVIGLGKSSCCPRLQRGQNILSEQTTAQ